MNEEITDYVLQNYYKRRLREDKFAYAKALNSQIWCAVRTIKHPMHRPAVFVIRNNNEAKVWGVQSCKSPWSCPVCSARRMSKESARIAAAIDALDNQFNEWAFMITFSVPHYHNFSCKQVYDILKETWARFVHQAKSKQNIDVFARFNNTFNCTHRIRVGEFTWGHYGWHPHYHCLFFVDKNKFNEVLDWQEKLSERWFTLAKRATIKILTRDKYCEDVKAFVEDFYSKTDHAKGKLDAVISTNEDGTIRRALSSDYICGWGANKELTGNVRKEATHAGHFTPHQLLRKSYELWKLDKRERADKFFALYVEYALATLRTYRVRMSPPLKKIIADWYLTSQYTETVKKKAIEEQKKRGRWELVCWFTPEQWYDICSLDLLPYILKLAMQVNGRQLIEQLLLEYLIDITDNGEYIGYEFFDEQIFNAAS